MPKIISNSEITIFLDKHLHWQFQNDSLIRVLIYQTYAEFQFLNYILERLIGEFNHHPQNNAKAREAPCLEPLAFFRVFGGPASHVFRRITPHHHRPESHRDGHGAPGWSSSASCGSASENAGRQRSAHLESCLRSL